MTKEVFLEIEMLPKNTDWSILAHCDFFAVANLVQTNDRPAMQTFSNQPMRHSSFQRKIERESTWRDTFEVFCKAYKNLSPDFEIKHDSFGGYRLVYTGRQTVSPGTVFKRNPVGFVTVVPDDVVTDLSVMSSKRTGEQLLLLGPMRFVNSDCEPNCEYDFSSDSQIVQLRVRKRISPGSEIFVKYGPEFFEANECRCRTCFVKISADKENNTAFDILLDTVIEELIKDCFQSLVAERTEVHCMSTPKRRRIRGKELVEMFNAITDSPLSDEFSPDFAENSSKRKKVQLSPRNCVPGSSSESTISLSSPDTLDVSEEFDVLSRSSSSEFEEQTAMPENYNHSPLKLPFSFPRDSSDFDLVSLQSMSNETASSEASEMLFHGSTVNIQNATSIAELFCSRFNLSDECSSAMFSLIKSFLPETNKFPSAYSYTKKMKNAYNEEVRILKKDSERSFCVMNFRYQIRDIVKRNLTSIFNYSSERLEKNDCDFNVSFIPPPKKEQNYLTVNLILFSDGVSIKKSTLKRELWPVWIQIADLPPKLRMSQKNIVLAALHVGSSYPNWKELVPYLRDQLNSSIDLARKERETVRLVFKVKLLVCDLGAKCHMLNMFKFNGYFGCHFCTAPGKTIGKTHAYYPYAQPGELRETEINDIYIDYAETLGLYELPNVVGVKGKSEFSVLIEGLPLTAPIDYMHCVLLGVFPDLLKMCYNALSPEDKIKVNIVICGLACPREMIAFSRKIRKLEELPQFKANEYFNWLFYLSPIIFRDRIPLNLYDHLLNLVFGIRLLMESSSVTHTNAAENLINCFCEKIVSIHDGNERIETINVHCLRHLTEQVKRFGPLYCYSAMCFEAANRTLGDLYTGSHSECEVICRRVLRRHSLVDSEIVHPGLRQLFCRLSGINDSTKQNFDAEFIETEALQIARNQYPRGVFFNRQIINNVYFDSLAYKRSKFGNCFVCFLNEEEEVFGQIQFFIQLPDSFSNGQVYANLKVFSVVEKIGPVEGFVYQVRSTSERALTPTESLKKVFYLRDFCKQKPQKLNTEYVVKLCASFEHS